MITAEQMRAARGLVRMSQADLARAANVSVETVKRMEGFTGSISANTLSLKAVEDALGAAGVHFIPGGDGMGPGVRLRKER